VDGEARRIVVRTGRPTRDAPATLRLFRERMAAQAAPLDPGFGFDQMRMSVPWTQALAPTQQGLERETPGEEAFSRLVDRLTARLGPEAVLRFEPFASHIPERAARLLPAAARHGDEPWPDLDPDDPPLRPLQMFDPPQPVETLAEVPDGYPLKFRWRRVLHEVTRAEGPERISGEWWRPEPAHPRLLSGRGPGRPSLLALPPGPLWRDARAALVHPRPVRMRRLDPCGANGLRKAMGTFRGDGTLHTYEDRMVGRMIARGYDPDFARRCFEQIKGFGSYGFPESHAASFARLVYVSSWIKHRHPAAFACALLNSQPMGFYAPAQIVREAQEVGGVEVRPIDVSHSDWDNSLEGPASAPVLRLGLRQIDGFKEDWAKALSTARAEAPFADVETLARRAELPAAAMRKLADADAFRSLGQDRREALWAVRRLPDDDPLPLFAAAEARERGARELGAEPDARLPLMPLGEHVAADYQTARLSLKAHPMAILRPVFAAERVLTCAETEAKRGGSLVQVAGVVLVRQRPGKGNAVFVTLEDETGITNIVLWARMLDQFRREIMGARLMQVEGVVEKSLEGVVHVVARRVIDRSAELSRLSEDHETDIQLAHTDIVANSQPPRHPSHRHPRDVRILPGSRDFH